MNAWSLIRGRVVTSAIVCAGLAVTGWLAGWAGQNAWGALKADVPTLTADDIEVAAGEGVMVGLLGGFRAITADLLWVRTNAVWEDQDLPGTQTLIRLVTTVDSRPLVFWINGARMIGYDMPVWRIDRLSEEAGAGVPSVVQQRIFHEQARAALAVLERARRYHPDEPLVLIEMANLLQRKMGDLEGAAALYRRAAEMDGAPYYAARIYAELLKQLGRYEEAYIWLTDVHRQLPREDANAMSDIVLGRIRELEEHLGIAPARRYQPAALGL